MSDLDTVTWTETARRDATSDDHGRIACTIDDRDHTVRYTVWSYAGHHAVERVVLHRAGFDDERMRPSSPTTTRPTPSRRRGTSRSGRWRRH